MFLWSNSTRGGSEPITFVGLLNGPELPSPATWLHVMLNRSVPADKTPLHCRSSCGAGTTLHNSASFLYLLTAKGDISWSRPNVIRTTNDFTQISCDDRILKNNFDDTVQVLIHHVRFLLWVSFGGCGWDLKYKFKIHSRVTFYLFQCIYWSRLYLELI